jgi:predicted amidohydrolase
MSAAPPADDVPRKVVVASVQMASVLGDTAANVARIVPLVEEAAAEGAKFIVLPETAIQGYTSQDLETVWHIPNRPLMFGHGLDPEPHAETSDGPTVQLFAALARRLAVYITVPYLECAVVEDVASDDDDDVVGAEEDVKAAAPPKTRTFYYNSIALVGPEGTVLGNYRKMSPWPLPEQSWASKGSDPVVVDTPYGRVGLAICFDIHTCLAKYARHRLWALLYPIAWVGEPDGWFRSELPKRLREMGCPHHVFGCNWSTDEPQHLKWEGQGFSTHYGPLGDVLASTGDQTGSTIIYSTVHTAHGMQEQRERHPRLSAQPVPTLNLDKYAAWSDTVKPQIRQWKAEW